MKFAFHTKLLLALIALLMLQVGELNAARCRKSSRGIRQMRQATACSKCCRCNTVQMPQVIKPSSDVAEPREFTAQDGKDVKKALQTGGYSGALDSSRLIVENKMILVLLSKALDLFKAEFGYYPRTQEEFMKRIINANNIILPELEANEEYVYDPNEPKKLKFRKKQ